MSLQPGARVGPYEILSPLGKGGMGEVYRARDNRLKRDVAIKMLPDAVAGDPERLARFEREAQLLAALQHPNVASIYGIEESGSARCIVMELVEGETLAVRLERGALAPSEAMPLARQIAEGLEAAHERGIVHRDLKPANIVVMAEGAVKILDFGLAKAFDDRGAGSGVDVSLSPTLTAASTRAGVILGTAAYMSPEQARGAPVDRRADIWAFGCVLLEMLTGRSVFAGETISDTLASILKTDPSWEGLPRETPQRLRLLLLRCLQKNPRARLRDIGEARIALEEILSGAAEAGALPATIAAPPRRPWPWMILAAVSLLAAAALGIPRLFTGPAAPPTTVHRFEIFPKDLLVDEASAPFISPDGQSILFRSQDRLWVRRLDQIEATPLAGTEGADHATWSPRGDEIAFMTGSEMWRMAIPGGERAAIGRGIGQFSPAGRLCWGAEDRIVYSNGNSGLLQIPARGGDAKPLLETDQVTEFDLHDPAVLPGKRGYLYLPHHHEGNSPDTIVVLADGRKHEVLRLAGQTLRRPVWSPTGHILFRRDSTNPGLWALPFALDRLQATGDPILIDAEGDYPSVSADGSLLYARGSVSGREQLVWVGLDGKVEGKLGQEQRQLRKPALSTDGKRVAVMGLDGDNGDVWVHDIPTTTRTRLTFTAALDWDPIWSPDGATIYFWDGDRRVISKVPADGSGAIERVVPEDTIDSGDPSISRDGRMLIFWVKLPTSASDLWYLPLQGERKSTPFMTTPAQESNPRFSPDGRYVAYDSDESGRGEIYLTRFPSGDGKWQVSTQGGIEPVWSPRGDRLYFRSGDAVMEAEISTQPTVRSGVPRRLFLGRDVGVKVDRETRFDISPDGRRFVMVQPIVTQGAGPRLLLVEHWRPESGPTR